MNCVRCGKDIGDAAFCQYCGARRTANTGSRTRSLVRLPSYGRIAGVCAGIADYFDTDVTLVRLLWVILSIVPGGFIGGLIAYVVAWIIMPPAEVPFHGGVRALLTRSTTDRKIAGVCGGIAEYLEIDSTVVRVAWAVFTIIPGAIVCGVLAYLVAWLIMPERRVVPVAATPSAA